MKTTQDTFLNKTLTKMQNQDIKTWNSQDAKKHINKFKRSTVIALDLTCEPRHFGQTPKSDCRRLATTFVLPSLLALDVERPETLVWDDGSSEPVRVRETREDVPRRRQQVPSERHPFHFSGFRWPRRRVG